MKSFNMQEVKTDRPCKESFKEWTLDINQQDTDHEFAKQRRNVCTTENKWWVHKLTEACTYKNIVGTRNPYKRFEMMKWDW